MELPRAIINMRNVQGRILLIVPATAISTVLVPAFFGWAIARRIWRLRLEERVSERLRIARDLHDTLLAEFSRSAAEVSRGGVLAVQGLRSSTVVGNDLARAIGTFGEGLAAERGGGACDFRVHVGGATRNLAPLVRDEVYRIAGEALRNAFRHAGAKLVEVEIYYDRRQLRLQVRDDGKGIDPRVLAEGGRAGHHGLPGLHERAKLVGGKLAVWSELDAGTEISVYS